MAPNPVITPLAVSASPVSSSASAWQVIRRGYSATPSSNVSSAGYQVVRISSMMNERGDFNGTCTKEQAMSITPETPDGSCASYFADVTDYCCAAVGGIYNATYQAVDVPEAQAMALDHPICSTTNYADMFQCYQYVTETHCSATTPVPYGVCNKSGPDTSRAVQQSSSAAVRSNPGFSWRWILALTGAVATTMIQLAGP